MPAKRKPSKRSPKPALQVKREAGRPEFVPTEADRRMVQGLAMYAIPQDEMCLHVINPQTNKPICINVLKKWFEHELAMGKAQGRTRVMAATFRNALGETETITEGDRVITRQTVPGNVTAQIWLGKTLYGLREVDPAPRNPDPAQAVAGQMPEDEASLISQARDVAFALALGKKMLENKKP